MSKASFRRLIKLQGYEITIKRVEGATTEEVTVVAAQSMWDQKSNIDEDSKDNKIRNIMSVHPLKYHGEIVGYKLETRG